MSKGLFVTGTGTDVGKTYVTALLVKKLCGSGVRAGYYKAAVSGNEKGPGGLIPGDGEYVREISQNGQSLASMVPYVYRWAVSPHLAAKLEGNPVEPERVAAGYRRLSREYDLITMEGSGGIVCPIRFDEKVLWLEDIIRQLKLPSLIVADAGLGSINSAVLTAEYMKQKKLPVQGFILNHYHDESIMERDNRYMIEQRTGLPVIECIAEGQRELETEAEVWEKMYA